MDSLWDELIRGFFRGIGYILAEVVFGTLCYWVGYPICKLATLGRYPRSVNVVYLDDTQNRSSGWVCSMVGLFTILIVTFSIILSWSS